MEKTEKDTMREARKWFSVDSKSFKISMEGEERTLKGFITERRKGMVSWIRFGEAGLRNHLKGIETCCKKEHMGRRSFEWKEKRRYYKLENHQNAAGRFLMCSVTDGEGREHKLFILEGQGFMKGWDLLTAKLRDLGIKEK